MLVLQEQQRSSELGGYLRFIGYLGLVPLAPPGGGHHRTVLAVGDKDSVETGKIHARRRHQGGQPDNELQRLEDDMRRIIAVSAAVLVAPLSSGATLRISSPRLTGDNCMALAYSIAESVKAIVLASA